MSLFYISKVLTYFFFLVGRRSLVFKYLSVLIYIFLNNTKPTVTVMVIHPDSLNTMHLLCLVQGDPSERAFHVEIAKSASIENLRTTIMELNPCTFLNVDAKDLVLWKVDIPIEDIPRNLVLANNKEKGIQKLYPTEKIGNIFGESLIEDNVHIIIEPPSIAVDLRHFSDVVLPHNIPESMLRFLADLPNWSFPAAMEGGYNIIFFYNCLEQGLFQDWPPHSKVLVGRLRGQQEHKYFGPFENERDIDPNIRKQLSISTIMNANGIPETYYAL